MWNGTTQRKQSVGRGSALLLRWMFYTPGSDEDFERLYREVSGRLLATLIAMVGDRAAAEDCLQEAFLRAYRRWGRWTPEAPAEAWIHRIAINVALNHRQKEGLREIGSLLRRLGRPRPEPDPGDLVVRADLLDAVRRLPGRQAAALVLRYFHGYTNREIGAALGVPERTVASRLISARRRLLKELGPAWLEPAEEHSA